MLAVLPDLREQMSEGPVIFIRRGDVLTRYGLTNRILASWQKRRLLPFVKVGRKTTLFKIEDIENFLKKYTVKMQ